MKNQVFFPFLKKQKKKKVEGQSCIRAIRFLNMDIKEVSLPFRKKEVGDEGEPVFSGRLF